jgi:D-xylose transport system ATP-binding protein
VADQIAVLYLGEMAAQVKRTDINQQQLVELITTGGHTVQNGVSA